MTPEQQEVYRRAAELGTIPDELNPLFLFATTSAHLLVRILDGGFDVRELARLELHNRGLDANGQWIKPIPTPRKKPPTQRAGQRKRR